MKKREPNENDTIIAKRIRSLLRRRRQQQKALAAVVGDEGAASRLMSKPNFELRTIEKLATYFGISLEEFFREAELAGIVEQYRDDVRNLLDVLLAGDPPLVDSVKRSIRMACMDLDQSAGQPSADTGRLRKVSDRRGA